MVENPLRAGSPTATRLQSVHASSAPRMISQQGPSLTKMSIRMSRGRAAQSLVAAAGGGRHGYAVVGAGALRFSAGQKEGYWNGGQGEKGWVF
jgi:hypothetical protein